MLYLHNGKHEGRLKMRRDTSSECSRRTSYGIMTVSLVGKDPCQSCNEIVAEARRTLAKFGIRLGSRSTAVQSSVGVFEIGNKGRRFNCVYRTVREGENDVRYFDFDLTSQTDPRIHR